MTPDRAIETAADYADAMMTARTAKNLLMLILLLMLLVQLAVFFVARYQPQWIQLPPQSAATQPIGLQAADATAAPNMTNRLLYYLTGIIDFAGIVLSIVLAMVLFLIVMVMLVGRLIGVSRLTSAYIWCLVLIVLLFPWQAFLMQAEFKVPGVLYTWNELTESARFGIDQPAELARQVLKWARFVGFPLLAVVILLSIQVKSNRGLRQALGESDITDARP